MKKIWKIFVGVIFLAVCSGCGIKKEQKKTIEDTKEKIYRECEMLAEGYRNIYENAVKENALYELSTIQKSMDYFGKYGYAVIDSYNQLDMVQSIKVDDFLKKAEKEKNGKTTIFQVIAGDHFIRYDLKTKQGKIDVEVSSFKWKEDTWQETYYHELPGIQKDYQTKSGRNVMEIIDMITKRKLKKMMSVLFISGCFFIGNTKCKGADLEYISQETTNYAVQERGYDLPVDEVVKEEAIEDCKNVMNQMKVIYQKADKGTSSNIVVSETIMEEMQEVLKEKNVPVITSAPYSNMANYSKMEEFLFRAEQDLPGDIVLYRINRDGGIERLKFNYDGTDMYLLAAKAVWGMNDNPSIVYVSYTRIEEWKYTEKGWFGYTLCVPKYPEVSEAVDGSSMIRIKPLSDECREVSKRCVYLLGYQGNNLLCSDWDRSDMEGLDYNGLYEYLYRMKYGERYEFSGNSSGIPAEEFENLIMEFLPITADQIKKWAVFDSEHQTYDWERLGCLNYSPTYFGTSLPEVVEIRDSGEGNSVLVVDAVCDTFICNDAVITSELTVKFNDDKSFKYMGNKILNNGTKEVPKYQYRIKRKN